MTPRATCLLRDRVIVPLLSLPRIRSELLLRLAQLDIAYRDSSLTQRAAGNGVGDLLPFRRGPRPGDRAPDAPGLAARRGVQMSLFDVFRGAHFTLLLFAPGDGSLAGLMELAHEVRGRLADHVRTYLVTTAPGVVAPDWSDHLLVDSSGEARRIYGAVGEAVYLVRPDGYVAFRGDASNRRHLHDYLGRISLAPPLATRSAEVAMV